MTRYKKSTPLAFAVKKLREEIGLTQDSLSSEAKISIREIQNIENPPTNDSYIRTNTLLKLAKGLKCQNVEELFEQVRAQENILQKAGNDQIAKIKDILKKHVLVPINHIDDLPNFLNIINRVKSSPLSGLTFLIIDEIECEKVLGILSSVEDNVQQVMRHWREGEWMSQSESITICRRIIDMCAGLEALGYGLSIGYYKMLDPALGMPCTVLLMITLPTDTQYKACLKMLAGTWENLEKYELIKEQILEASKVGKILVM